MGKRTNNCQCMLDQSTASGSWCEAAEICQLLFVSAFLSLNFLFPFTHIDFVSFSTMSAEGDIDYTITCEFYFWIVTFAVYCLADLAVSLCLSLPSTLHLLSSLLLSYPSGYLQHCCNICSCICSQSGIQGPLWVLQGLQEGPLQN